MVASAGGEAKMNTTTRALTLTLARTWAEDWAYSDIEEMLAEYGTNAADVALSQDLGNGDFELADGLKWEQAAAEYGKVFSRVTLV
jgi:hypothetical protein